MKKTKYIPTPFELFGFEIGKGWMPLVEPIVQRIQELNQQGLDIKITQVKEKYGELCVYLSGYTEELEQMIRDAEEKSIHICEFCGQPAQRVWGNYGWIYTLCQDCLEERKIKIIGSVESKSL